MLVEGSCVYAADVAGTPDAATADTDGTTAGQQGDLTPPGSDPLAVQPGERLQARQHTALGPPPRR